MPRLLGCVSVWPAAARRRSPERRSNSTQEVSMRGVGRTIFAATLLLLVGAVNILYGFGALGDASIFVNQQRFIFTNLHTMGWILIILGVIQLSGGVSLIAGNTYGRVIGIIAGSL